MFKKKKFIYIIFLVFFLLLFVKPVKAEEINIDEIENQISAELGKEEAKELLNELKNMSELTRDKVIEKCGEYGISLSEIQLDSVISNIKTWGEESGFFATMKEYFLKFWEWIKELGRNSTVEVNSNSDKNQPIIKKDGDNITITIPKTEDVDNMVDGIIDKVKEYMIPKEDLEKE